eukprot:TRINITY_DN939_c0_g1_i13.p1 TRINITY_DN939_c0_g1~~TRINITY_DN939_c0_g1_i13.p1  ORF type:complete len:103 (+),score=19.58 TRINITY_DN939_c0_g1_i13:240-548(+)
MMIVFHILTKKWMKYQTKVIFLFLSSFDCPLVANAFKADGLNYGECVALLMENKPEFIFTWLEIAKAGGITAFINTNQSGKTLIHLSLVKPNDLLLVLNISK